MAIDQEPARRFYRELLAMSGKTTKEIAESVGVVPATLYNWLKDVEPTNLGAGTLSRVASALGVTVEQLFYNAPHEQAGAPPQAPEDWREQIREIERYVRSIESPAERLATVKRLLAIAKTDVEVWERSLDERAATGRAGDSPKPTPGTNRGRHGRPVS